MQPISFDGVRFCEYQVYSYPGFCVAPSSARNSSSPPRFLDLNLKIAISFINHIFFLALWGVSGIFTEKLRLGYNELAV